MYTITNGILTVTISEKGAELQSVMKNGKEYLYQGDEGWKRKAPLLFPWAGRLKDFRYSLDGVVRQMGQHGFARDTVMEVEDQGLDYIIFTFKPTAENLEVYPRDFVFHHGYRLLEDKLEFVTRIENKSGKEMPFGLGYHPGFKFLGGMDENFFTVTSEKELVKLGATPEGKLKTTEPEPVKDHFDLNYMKQDDTMIIFHSQKALFTSLDRSIELDMGTFPYLVLWENNYDKFICIEVWDNLPSMPEEEEVFETRGHLVRLPAGETYTASCSYRFF